MDTVYREDLYEALTEREQTILQLIDQGMSDHEIANALSLSRNTVKWYARRMFDKLHVKRRTQAVATARSLGLLHTPSFLDSGSNPITPMLAAPIIGRAQELTDL